MARDVDELVDAYCDANGYHHFEGDSGVERLENVLGALGYRGHNFRFGTPIESFLSDNPGAIEAVLNWVREQHTPEWIENLEGEVPAVEEEDDELD